MLCKICNKEKDLTEFYQTNKSVCKECCNKRSYEQRVLRMKKYAEENGITYNPRGHRVISNDPTKKWCNECKQFLPLDAFGYHVKKGNRYINSCCKKCMVKKVQRCPNREETVLKANINKKVRSLTDPEYNSRLKRYDRKYDHSTRGLIKTMLNNARKRASLFNLEYNLEVDDIVLPEECPILKHKFEIGKVGGSKYSYSLDRIDPNKGYIKGNVQVISRLANAMKNNASPQELKLFAQYILENY